MGAKDRVESVEVGLRGGCVHGWFVLGGGWVRGGEFLDFFYSRLPCLVDL